MGRSSVVAGAKCGLLAALLGACGGEGDAGRSASADSTSPSQLESSEAASQLLASVQARFVAKPLSLEGFASFAAAPWAPPFDAARTARVVAVGETLVPDGTGSARVALAKRARGAFTLQDAKSGMGLSVHLNGTSDALGEYARGAVSYLAGHALGDLIVRPRADGFEDYVVVADARPSGFNRLDYEVELNASVAGLRLVGGALEFLDPSGDPRLRIAPPYLVDSAGSMRSAALDVTGCDVDRDPSPPWGRAVVDPKSSSCAVSVSWDPAGLQFPLLVDPTWSSTANMSIARRGHVLSAPSTTTAKLGLVLAAGGVVGSSLLSSAELFNPTTKTWAVTASMPAGRFVPMFQNKSQTASGVVDDYVVVIGGMNTVTNGVTATAVRYRFQTGTWSNAGTMPKARFQGAAASPDTNKVLVTGGLSVFCTDGTCLTHGADIYDFGSNSWSTAPAPSSDRYAHTLTRLAAPSGPAEVLRVGGALTGTTIGAGTCEKYNAANRIWIAAGTLPTPVSNHTATLCVGGCASNSDGRVIVTGGIAATGYTAVTQTYNPVSNTWASGVTMPGAIGWQGAVLVSAAQGDKRVLVVGGLNSSNQTVNTAWLWPSGPTTHMAFEREQLGVTVLRNGQVLVAGGYRSQSGGEIAGVELFTP